MKFMVTRVKKNGRFIVLLSLAIFSLSITKVYAYPAPQFQDAKVFSFHAADDSITTIFFAIISGPSPVDVASFMATGPSGPYNLTSRQSFQQYGLYYAHVEPGVLNNGSYTLTVTDSIGRTASVVREFTYNDSIPTATSLVPADKTYAVSTTPTPTFSFSPVTGNYCYQAQIRDYDGKAIWYSSPFMTIPSFTFSKEMLQADTAYRYKARVWDIVGQNCRESEALFYTGTKAAPEINLKGILSISTSNLINFIYSRAINVAPWDIDYFRFTGPDNVVYDLNGRYYQFTFPAYNANVTSFDPPASIPSGTYTVEIKDSSGRTDSDTRSYTYNPIPEFSEDSRIPVDNAYLDTDKPTFSWSRVQGDAGDGTYLYSIRIVDNTQQMRWFDSPSSTATSFTPNEALNLPKGSSYKWRVNVIDADGNNYRNSSYHTITFNLGSAPSVVYVNNTDDTCDGNDPCYTSIQAAINVASATASIRLAEGTYNEIFRLGLSKTLTLEGGWDSKFSVQSANKTFIKAPIVTDGSLAMKMLTIQP